MVQRITYGKSNFFLPFLLAIFLVVGSLATPCGAVGEPVDRERLLIILVFGGDVKTGDVIGLRAPIESLKILSSS